MKSPQHRANILDPDMDSAGIGIACVGTKTRVWRDGPRLPSVAKVSPGVVKGHGFSCATKPQIRFRPRREPRLPPGGPPLRLALLTLSEKVGTPMPAITVFRCT
jgi:hypothetical protein